MMQFLWETWLLIFIVGCGLHGCSGQMTDTYCEFVVKMDCSSKPSDVVCDTGGKTYPNICYFSQAYCGNHTIHLAHYGPCIRPVAQSNPVNGSVIALDIFCMDLFHHTCDGEPAYPVCASNLMTYPSLCEFDKARCTHRHLYLLKSGHC